MTETIYDIFNTPNKNKDAFENGKWFSINDTSKIRLRGAASPESVRVRKEVEEPYAARIDAGMDLTTKETEEVTLRIVSKGIISGWEGPIFVDDKGKKIKYTAENAYKLISDPKLDKFLLFILESCRKEDNYLAKLDDVSEKN